MRQFLGQLHPEPGSLPFMVPQPILSFWIGFYSVCSKLGSCLSLLPTLWSIEFFHLLCIQPLALPWTLAIWMVSRGLETKIWLDCEFMINLLSAWLKNCTIARLCLYGFLAEGLSYREKTANDASWPLNVWWPSGSSPLVSNIPREVTRHSDLVYAWSFYIFWKVSFNCPCQNQNLWADQISQHFLLLGSSFLSLTNGHLVEDLKEQYEKY